MSVSQNTQAAENFAKQRDTILPRKVMVKVPPMEGLENGYDLEIPRLTLGRTLRLSSWLDNIIDAPKVQDTLMEVATLFTDMSDPSVEVELEVDPETGEPLPGQHVEAPDVSQQTGATFALQIGRIIVKLLASLSEEQAVEFYTIITTAEPDFVRKFWEPGWGVSAIQAAFQQQGFKNVLGNATGVDLNQGETQVPQTGAEGNPSPARENSSVYST